MTARQFHIGLVACSRTKADHDVPARELYVSPLFRAARQYAENHYDPASGSSCRPGTALSIPTRCSLHTT